MAMSTKASRSFNWRLPSCSAGMVSVMRFESNLLHDRWQPGIQWKSAISLRLQLREEDHVADAFLAEEHHAQAVNADADAARRGHAVFKRDEEIFVQLLLFAAGLMLQRGALRDGIVLLGVAGRNLLPVDATLEDFDGRWVVGRKLGQRHEFLRQMRDECGLNK